MRPLCTILTVAIAFRLALVAGVASAQTGTSSSNVTVFDWDKLELRNYGVTTRTLGNSHSVTVFDWQNPGFKNYDVTVRGSGSNKSVTVFDWQNPGYSNYNVSVHGAGRTQSVTVFDWQKPGYKSYGVTTIGNGNIVPYVPIYDSPSAHAANESQSTSGTAHDATSPGTESWDASSNPYVPSHSTSVQGLGRTTRRSAVGPPLPQFQPGAAEAVLPIKRQLRQQGAKSATPELKPTGTDFEKLDNDLRNMSDEELDALMKKLVGDKGGE